MPEIVIFLRWPYAYSPNRGRRMTTSARSGHEKEDREKAKEAVEQAGYASGLIEQLRAQTDGVRCSLYLHPPDDRKRDTQTGCMITKAAIDGVCDGLGINDLVISDFSAHRRPAIKGGRVDVVLSWGTREGLVSQMNQAERELTGALDGVLFNYGGPHLADPLTPPEYQWTPRGQYDRPAEGQV